MFVPIFSFEYKYDVFAESQGIGTTLFSVSVGGKIKEANISRPMRGPPKLILEIFLVIRHHSQIPIQAFDIRVFLRYYGTED